MADKIEKGRGGARGTGARGKAAAEAKPAGKQSKKDAKAPKWTKARKEIFFAELSELCNVAAAARAAGFPDGKSADRQKRNCPDFRARFEAAVCESYSKLELEMLERGRLGDNRPEPQGESEKRLREIPTTLAMNLLKFHQSSMRGKGAVPDRRRPMRGAKLRDEIERRLSEINRRLGGNG